MDKQLCHVGLRLNNKRVALTVDYAGSYTQNVNNINKKRTAVLQPNFPQRRSGNWKDQLQSTDFFSVFFSANHSARCLNQGRLCVRSFVRAV